LTAHRSRTNHGVAVLADATPCEKEGMFRWAQRSRADRASGCGFVFSIRPLELGGESLAARSECKRERIAARGVKASDRRKAASSQALSGKLDRHVQPREIRNAFSQQQVSIFVADRR